MGMEIKYSCDNPSCEFEQEETTRGMVQLQIQNDTEVRPRLICSDCFDDMVDQSEILQGVYNSDDAPNIELQPA